VPGLIHQAGFADAISVDTYGAGHDEWIMSEFRGLLEGCNWLTSSARIRRLSGLRGLSKPPTSSE